MNNIVCKVAALGGTISTTDISHLSEYKRLLRAKERGDLIKLRHGIYAVPDAFERHYRCDECDTFFWTVHRCDTCSVPGILSQSAPVCVFPHLDSASAAV